MVEQLLAPVIQPIIERAASEVTRKFLESLPSAQFERIEYNGGWEVEEEEK